MPEDSEDSHSLRVCPVFVLCLSCVCPALSSFAPEKVLIYSALEKVHQHSNPIFFERVEGSVVQFDGFV